MAQLNVEDAWVITVIGVPLVVGVEVGPNAWVGVGGKLPSGTCIELLKYPWHGRLFELYADAGADPRATLNEFLNVTGLEPTAVHWQSEPRA